MRRTVLATLLLLPACGEDNEPTPTGSSQPASDPSLPESGGDATATTPMSGGESSEETSAATSDPDPTETPGTDGTGTATTTPDETGGETGLTGLRWETDIYPNIIAPSCNCHVGGSGGLVMGEDPETAYNAIYLVPAASAPLPYILPTSPEMSYLFAKVTDTHLELGGSGSPMPLGGPPLTSNELEQIAQWILEGAAY